MLTDCVKLFLVLGKRIVFSELLLNFYYGFHTCGFGLGECGFSIGNCNFCHNLKGEVICTSLAVVNTLMLSTSVICMTSIC